jgi:hypothetical protein
VHQLLVNHRDRTALVLTDAEAASLQDSGPADAESETLLAELLIAGFLTDSPTTDSDSRSGRLGFTTGTLDLRWTGADRLVRWLYRHGARHAFTPIAVVVQAVVATVGLVAVLRAVLNRQEFHLQAQPGQLPVLLFMTLLAVAVHECAHGLVVVHHGRHVDAAGFRMLLGTPAFYVESVDALLLTRRQRMVQAAAGPWAEWLVTSVVAVWFWWAPVVLFAPLLHRFIVLNSVNVVSNLAPFVGLDGYLLLADGVRIPDLAQRSRCALGETLLSLAARRRSTREQRILAAYALTNGVVAGALLATAAFCWWATFGSLVEMCLAGSATSRVALAAALCVIVRPIVRTTLAAGFRAWMVLQDFAGRLRFHHQWWWRVPATEALARSDSAIAALEEHTLNLVAGHLRRGDGASADVATVTVRSGRRTITAWIGADVIRKLAAEGPRAANGALSGQDLVG